MDLSIPAKLILDLAGDDERPHCFLGEALSQVLDITQFHLFTMIHKSTTKAWPVCRNDSRKDPPSTNQVRISAYKEFNARIKQEISSFILISLFSAWP
jgi:hypothetical protein